MFVTNCCFWFLSIHISNKDYTILVNTVCFACAKHLPREPMVWFKTFGCLGSEHTGGARLRWLGGAGGHIWILEIKDLADKCEGTHMKEQSKIPNQPQQNSAENACFRKFSQWFLAEILPTMAVFTLNLRHTCFTHFRKKSKERKPMELLGVKSYAYLDLFHISSYYFIFHSSKRSEFKW